eukprot:TRINITY_DN2002_c2_g1_i16.p1 TRINITY_DN2002_c2_g1~~TRINITY_DN2002_c2_g1_i16.p1  ORF type:complete len:265 (+),score=72.14 TRINITY_DN2002_c2_g1_i16:570-1364(+)
MKSIHQSFKSSNHQINQIIKSIIHSFHSSSFIIPSSFLHHSSSFPSFFHQSIPHLTLSHPKPRSTMPSIFVSLKETWAAIPLKDNEVSIEEFLAACTEIVGVFDNMGSTLSPVKSDMNGNIEKLTNWYKKDESVATMQKLVQVEIDAKTTTKSGSATDALLWLRRALNFIRMFLTHVTENTDKELTESASFAYGESLSKYHGWAVRQVFNLAMKGVPYRADWIKSVSDDESDDKTVCAEIEAFLEVAIPYMDNLTEFYGENSLE